VVLPRPNAYVAAIHAAFLMESLAKLGFFALVQ
jgi:hypothetical protein